MASPRDTGTQAHGILLCFGPSGPQQLSRAERCDPITVISDNEVVDQGAVMCRQGKHVFVG